MALVAFSPDRIECNSFGFKRSFKLALSERRINVWLRRCKYMPAGA